MATARRWSRAQDYERKQWEKLDNLITPKQTDLESYSLRADRLQTKFLQPIPHISLAKRSIVEIGSGPHTCNFISSSEEKMRKRFPDELLRRQS